ncbi:hypothetical protein [uncultured Aquimarina sp.]|uniref:hypothetical protein n=1 Tax=uncultured Aquimarina sp. TaxID=575652 RepID=UPI0026270FEF|nr:hypothetical protein [uncultured Aquimarina sp.]
METDISQVLVQSLTGLFYVLPTLVFIIISSYYLMKMGGKMDGILILVGNIIIFLSSIINQVLFIQLSVYQSWDGYYYSYISTALSILSFIGSILFVAGTFLLIRKVIKTKSSTEVIAKRTVDDNES